MLHFEGLEFVRPFLDWTRDHVNPSKSEHKTSSQSESGEHHRTDNHRVFFRPDGIGTVTVEEKERFEEIKERLRVLLENQITHFRSDHWCRTGGSGPALIRLP